MPFTGPNDSTLPKNIQSLPLKKREQFVGIFNDVFERCQDEGGKDCEGAAFKQANGVVLKDNSLNFACNQIEQSRRENVGGREFIVAPVVAIRAGVLKGELVPGDEIAQHFASWDGRPFILGHPDDGKGTAISANDPRILAQQAIGQLFNTEFDGERLRGEVWVDVDKARSVGGDALEVMSRLEDGEPLEVSTAYFRDVTDESGTFGGVDFESVARNLRPDHLAALVREIGACSWEDGCGAPRVNQEEAMGEAVNTDTIVVEPKAEEENVPEHNSLLKVFADTLRALIKSLVSNQEETMSIEEAIALIVEDGRLGLTAEDMSPLSEEAVAKLIAHLQAMDEAAGQQEPPPEEKPEEEPEVAAATVPLVPASNTDGCPDELKALAAKANELGGIQSAMAQIDALIVANTERRTKLIEALTANSACAFKADALAEMSNDHLETLTRSLQPADYSGQAAPVVAANQETIITLSPLM